ncbi:MAG: acyltransferase family protein, partial [Oscillospiraceae bacterium]|nr:acyltransferase family protein [Oscillospiraceae bacterium]
MNVGVPLFFMMSGYLLSCSKSTGSYLYWIKRRFSRLLIPYWVFVALYILAAYFSESHFDLKSILWNIIPVSGLTENYLYSTEGHLWFITHIAICYLIFPLIRRLNSPSTKKPSLFLLVFFSLYIVILFTVNRL